MALRKVRKRRGAVGSLTSFLNGMADMAARREGEKGGLGEEVVGRSRRDDEKVYFVGFCERDGMREVEML